VSLSQAALTNLARIVAAIGACLLVSCAPYGTGSQAEQTASWQTLPVPPLNWAKARPADLRPPWMRLQASPKGETGYTFVTEMWDTAVNAYEIHNRKGGGPVCQVGPVRIAQGMTVDASGNLYVVTHFLHKIGVATFGPNCGNPGRRFVSPRGLPQDPITDGNTLYVTELSDLIEVYGIRSGESPLRKLSDKSVAEGIGLAVDSHHNLFWSVLGQPWMQGEVVIFASGKMPGRVLVAPKMGHDFPGGVMTDRSDNLLLVDQTANAIYIYAPPYKTPPFSVIPLKGTAVYCALTPRQDRLYCMDYQYGSVDAYKYPGGAYLYSYTNGIDESEEPIGIAIQPASS